MQRHLSLSPSFFFGVSLPANNSLWNHALQMNASDVCAVAMVTGNRFYIPVLVKWHYTVCCNFIWALSFAGSVFLWRGRHFRGLCRLSSLHRVFYYCTDPRAPFVSIISSCFDTQYISHTSLLSLITLATLFLKSMTAGKKNNNLAWQFISNTKTILFYNWH